MTLRHVSVRTSQLLSATALAIALGGTVLVPASAATTAGSTDGRIAFVRNDKIMTIEPDGTDRQVLVADGTNVGPSWSPDGSRIAFVRADGAGGFDLWTMAADGSDRVQMTDSGEVVPTAPSWTPDGSKIAFGGPCMEREGRPCWQDSAVDLVAADDPLGVPVSFWGESGEHQGWDDWLYLDRGFALSPSGDGLVFESSYLGWAGSAILTIKFGSSETSGSIRMVDYADGGGTFGVLGNPTYAADGQTLLYDKRYGDVEGETYDGIGRVLPGVGERPFREVEDDRDAAPSPSGEHVVLVRDLAVDRLVITDERGRDRQRLVRGSQPSWQPVPSQGR